MQTVHPDPQLQGRRRWGVMVIGIVVSVIGLGLLVGGAVGGAIEQTRSNADPEAEGRTPGSLTFLADAVTYRVSVEDEEAGATPR